MSPDTHILIIARKAKMRRRPHWITAFVFGVALGALMTSSLCSRPSLTRLSRQGIPSSGVQRNVELAGTSATPPPPDSSTPKAPRSSPTTNLLEAVERQQSGDRVFLIPVNSGYLDFALNLACSLAVLRGIDTTDKAAITQIRGLLFVAMDSEVLGNLSALGMPVASDPEIPFVSSKSASWADPKFHSLVCTKLIPVRNVLSHTNISVLLSDADIVFVQDPVPYLRDDVDITWSIGSCHRDLPDNFNFAQDASGIAKLNTGFYFAHAKPSVISLLNSAFSVCRSSELTGDQPAINQVMKSDLESKAKMDYSYGFFDGCLFANGCVYFKHLCANVTTPDTQRGADRRNPVMVHANFLVGKKEKVRHLRKYGLWNERCIATIKEEAVPRSA